MNSTDGTGIKVVFIQGSINDFLITKANSRYKLTINSITSPGTGLFGSLRSTEYKPYLLNSDQGFIEKLVEYFQNENIHIGAQYTIDYLNYKVLCTISLQRPALGGGKKPRGFAALSVKELQKRCKKLNIKYSGLHKADLVAALRNKK